MKKSTKTSESPQYIFESGKYELVLKDGQIGTSSIVGRSHDVSVLIKKAVELVSNDNIDNALTQDQAQISWSSYFVEVLKLDAGEQLDNLSIKDLQSRQSQKQIVYGGKTNIGKNIVYVFQDQDVSKSKSTQIQVSKLNNRITFRLFLGRNQIDSIKNKQGKNTPVYKNYFATINGRNRKIINDLNSDLISNKNVYYIRKSRSNPQQAL